MANLYGTLSPLAQALPLADGGSADAINIYRLTFGQLAAVLDVAYPTARLGAIVGSCRAVAQDGTESQFKATDLDASDGAELVRAIADMLETDDVSFEGDGVNHPMVYRLKYPVKFGDTPIDTFEFSAKRIGDIVSFMDARGDANEFREFMRSFGSIVGAPLPITDALVDMFDVYDYAMLKEHVMGKLATSRRRLKKV